MTNKCILCDMEGIDFGSKPDYNKYDSADPSGVSYGVRRYYSFLKCPKCELFWVKDPDENYDDLYKSEEYWWNYHKRRGWNSLDEKPRIDNDIKYAKLRLEFINSNFIPSATKAEKDLHTVLEIGCSTGALLKELYEDGFNTVGVEPNERVAKIAEEFSGVPVETDINSLEGLNGHCSIVIAIDVLEHLKNPVDEVKKWVDKLRIGGKLFLELPDAGCGHCIQQGINWHDYVIPTEHIYYYRKNHVVELFKKFNCKPLHIDNWLTTDRQRLVFELCNKSLE